MLLTDLIIKSLFTRIVPKPRVKHSTHVEKPKKKRYSSKHLPNKIRKKMLRESR